LFQDATGGHAPSLEEQRAMLVDRGVGSPNFARPTKETFSVSNFKLDSEAKVVHTLDITTKSLMFSMGL
jgi:6-phosphofructo-2-kinase/fructose-2,6-biphosphatase